MNWTTEKKPTVKPILVYQIKGSLRTEQWEVMNAKFKAALEGTGWDGMVLDCCDVAEVRAFGVPESQLETLHNVKMILSND